MGTWNYRVVHHKETIHDEPREWCAIHEVYYDEDGRPARMSKDPVTFLGDDADDLIRKLQLALWDAEHRDVFEPPEEWT